jgi:hypothetical protein
MSAPPVKIVLKRAVFGLYRAKAGDTVMRPADEAAKLVKMGVASYVTPPTPPAPAPTQTSGGQANG